MIKTLPIAAFAVFAAILPGCSKQAAPTQNTSAGTMTNMAMPTEPRVGKATGTVTAIDEATGKITLDHSQVPELQWPAMKMGFGAKPEQLKGLAVGDKVVFGFTMTGTNAEISTISKQ